MWHKEVLFTVECRGIEDNKIIWSAKFQAASSNRLHDQLKLFLKKVQELKFKSLQSLESPQYFLNVDDNNYNKANVEVTKRRTDEKIISQKLCDSFVNFFSRPNTKKSAQKYFSSLDGTFL